MLGVHSGVNGCTTVSPRFPSIRYVASVFCGGAYGQMENDSSAAHELSVKEFRGILLKADGCHSHHKSKLKSIATVW